MRGLWRSETALKHGRADYWLVPLAHRDRGPRLSGARCLIDTLFLTAAVADCHLLQSCLAVLVALHHSFSSS